MKTFVARTQDIKEFVNQVANYETYLISGEYPGNRPLNQTMYGIISLSVKSEDNDNFGQSIRLNITKQPMMCEYYGYKADEYEKYGKVKSFRAYDKREKKDDERLENCKVIDWGYAGIVIMCEDETIVIKSPKKKTKYTTVDGKYHEIKKCCECPYIDTEYGMCRYPNSSKDIPITDYEGITKGCPLRDKE